MQTAIEVAALFVKISPLAFGLAAVLAILTN